MAGTDPRTQYIGLIQLTVGAVMISFSPVMVKLAHAGSVATAFYRCLFGGIILLVLALARKEKFRQGRPVFLAGVLCGFFFALDLVWYHRSIHFVGPGLATILTNFQVFYLALFGALVLKDRLSPRFIMAVPLALFGLIMIVGFEWRSLSPDFRTGIWLGLIAGLAYASYILTLRKAQSLVVKPTPMAIMAVVSLTVALLLVFMVPLSGESFRIPDGQTWAALIAYGVFGQVIGWVVISKALVKVDASRAGLVLLLQPALAFSWDVLFFGRSAQTREIMGAVLAIAAIYLGSVRPFRRRSRPASPAH